MLRSIPTGPPQRDITTESNVSVESFNKNRIRGRQSIDVKWPRSGLEADQNSHKALVRREIEPESAIQQNQHYYRNTRRHVRGLAYRTWFGHGPSDMPVNLSVEHHAEDRL
ncbi:hypothetical protein AcV7_007736 [Taiwanofungus camphoratus]|nr:hypothetical protein AcV7_007736 [Antrodia cinnamomea]